MNSARAAANCDQKKSPTATRQVNRNPKSRRERPGHTCEPSPPLYRYLGNSYLQSISDTGSGSQQESALPPVVREVLQSPGQALDPSICAIMQARLKADLRKVRVHTDAQVAGREVEHGRNFSGDLPACGVGLSRQPVPQAEIERAELTFSFDARKRTWRRYARSEGRKDAARIRKSGKLSIEDRKEVNAKLGFFEGQAKEAYIREIRPTLVDIEAAEQERLREREATAAYYTSTRQSVLDRMAKEQAQRREREGMLAYYTSTRQAVLDRMEAELREEISGISSRQIDSQWKSRKQAFISVASSPGHQLNRQQLLRIYILYWADRNEAARAMYGQIKYLEPKDRLAAEEAATDEENFAGLMLRTTVSVNNFLLAAEDRGKQYTLPQLNEEAIKLAEFHEAMVSATGMIVPGGLRLVPLRGRVTATKPRTSTAPPSSAEPALPAPLPAKSGTTAITPVPVKPSPLSAPKFSRMKRWFFAQYLNAAMRGFDISGAHPGIGAGVPARPVPSLAQPSISSRSAAAGPTSPAATTPAATRPASAPTQAGKALQTPRSALSKQTKPAAETPLGSKAAPSALRSTQISPATSQHHRVAQEPRKEAVHGIRPRSIDDDEPTQVLHRKSQQGQPSQAVRTIEPDVQPLPDATVLQLARPIRITAAYVRDVHETYRNLWRQDPSREAGLYHNPVSRDFIIVQGDAQSVIVSTKGQQNPLSGGKSQEWKEILDAGQDVGRWELVRHYHPPAPGSQYVSDVGRLPSGALKDMDVIYFESVRADGKARTSTIDYLTAEGPNYTTFSFNPDQSKPFSINYPDPKTGVRTPQRFADLQDYHDWVRRTFHVDLGPVPKGHVAGESLRVHSTDILEPAGRLERSTDDPSQVDRRHYHAREFFGEKSALGAEEARYFAEANLRQDGIVDLDFRLRREIKAGAYRSSQLRGQQEFRRAIAHFRRHNGPGSVKGIRGDWNEGDNLARFNKRFNQHLADKLSRDEAFRRAALETPTGGWAKNEGFTEVRRETEHFNPNTNEFEHVVVVFVKSPGPAVDPNAP